MKAALVTLSDNRDALVPLLAYALLLIGLLAL
jgi:hypothetical protein